MHDSAALPVPSSQLQATLSNMALALSHVDESIVWTDGDGRIQWYNSAFERLVNQTAATLAEQMLTQLLPLTLKGEPLPLSHHPANWGLATKQRYEGQYGFYRHDRSLALAITVAPLPSSETDLPVDRGVMLIMRDITAPFLKQRSPQSISPKLDEAMRVSTTEIHQSNRWVTNILESITDAFYTLDENWCFTYLNHQAEHLLQRSCSDLLGCNAWEQFPETVGSIFDREYHRAVEAQCSAIFESFCTPLNIWFEVRVYPLASGLAVYFQDISERKRIEIGRQQTEAALCDSETRLRLALKAAQMSNWDWDIQNDTVVYAGSLSADFAIPSASHNNAYASFLEDVHPDDRAFVARSLALALKGAAYNIEFRVHWAGGTQHWVCSQGQVYFDQQGRPVRMLGVARNITKRKQAELALQTLNQELEQRVQQRTTQLKEANRHLEGVIMAHEQTEAALRKSEERFRTIFDNAPIAISLADIHTYQIVEVNQAHHALFGYSKDNLATMTYVDITHPDDINENLEQIKQLLDGVISRFQIEKRFVKKKGIVSGQP